jgi:hypothetical protein
MSNTKFIRVTPTIDTAAYTAGDQVGGLQTLTGAVSDAADRSVTLTGLTVIDRDAEGAALRVYFFRAAPTNSSANNAAYNLSDAEAASLLIGFVDIATGDYVADSGFKMACKSVNIPLISTDQDTELKYTGKIYAVATTSGTPTYTAATDLTFVYALED